MIDHNEIKAVVTELENLGQELQNRAELTREIAARKPEGSRVAAAERGKAIGYKLSADVLFSRITQLKKILVRASP